MATYQNGECPTCHKVLRGITAFDRHRTGAICIKKITSDGTTHYFRNPLRRCMTDEEMTASGLEFNGRSWGFPGSEENKERLRKLRVEG